MKSCPGIWWMRKLNHWGIKLDFYETESKIKKSNLPSLKQNEINLVLCLFIWKIIKIIHKLSGPSWTVHVYKWFSISELKKGLPDLRPVSYRLLRSYLYSGLKSGTSRTCLTEHYLTRIPHEATKQRLHFVRAALYLSLLSQSWTNDSIMSLAN